MFLLGFLTGAVVGLVVAFICAAALRNPPRGMLPW